MEVEDQAITWRKPYCSSNSVLMTEGRDFSLKPKMMKKREEEGKPPMMMRWVKHYCSSHKILLVGEGDFSFSACLAKAFGSAQYMVATSLDSLEELGMSYGKALRNIIELRKRGCNVIHNINARKLSQYSILRRKKFDRIVFNFPHAGFGFRSSDRDFKIRRHQRLVKAFLSNAKIMLAKDGEIHITSKTTAFYLDWKLESLALGCGLSLIEEVGFQLNDYSGYKNKYGDGSDKNFNWYPSKTYKFASTSSK